MLATLERLHTFMALDTYRRNALHLPHFQANRDRYIIFSDLHKGDHRQHVDEFRHNEKLYCDALHYYLQHDYGLILNGDIEEGWKNRYGRIIAAYGDSTYAVEREFARQGQARHLRIWGNHDYAWSRLALVKRFLRPILHRPINVFPAVLLGNHILITHGHQGDPKSDFGARLSQLVVRYIWRPLQQTFGLERPVIAEDNPIWRTREFHLHEWARSRRLLLIAGHTHRPSFMPETLPNYLNSGCCIAENGIHGIEIDRGMVRLVKWQKSSVESVSAQRVVYQSADLNRMLALVQNPESNHATIPLPKISLSL